MNDNDRPEPLRTAGAWAAVMTLSGAGLVLAASFGLSLTSDQRNAVLGFLAAAGPLVTAMVAWRRGRVAVTPVSDPRNNSGERLVPFSAAVATNRAQEATDKARARLGDVERLREAISASAPTDVVEKRIREAWTREHEAGLHDQHPQGGCPVCRTLARLDEHADTSAARPADPPAAGQPPALTLDEASDMRGLPVALDALKADAARHGLAVQELDGGKSYAFYAEQEPTGGWGVLCSDPDCAYCGMTPVARDLRDAMDTGRVR